MARDRLQEAVDELYGGEPAEFLPHRKELAAAARAAKDRDAATAIAALRKPTRSAHVLNQLARREPERVDELLRLADDAAAGTGRSRRDALRAMRELTTRRRHLIDDLAARAFAGAGEESPTAGVHDEVVATLNAAVGDPEVGTELAEGRLVRSHEWSGFGFSAADLALVPDQKDKEPEQEDEEDDGAEAEDNEEDDGAEADDTEGDGDLDDGDQPEEDQPDGHDTDTDTDTDTDDKTTDDEPDDDDDPADDAVRRADRELTAQQRAEQEQQDRIAELEDELTEAQIRLDEIRVAIRRAEMERRKARAAADHPRRAED